MHGTEDNPETWFGLARMDLQRSIARLAEGDIDDCTFRLQQAAEKAMKGRLISLGWKLERTHSLESLISSLRMYEIEAKWFVPTAEILETEYFATRYPRGFDEAPSPEETAGLLADVRALFALLSVPVGPEKTAGTTGKTETGAA